MELSYEVTVIHFRWGKIKPKKTEIQFKKSNEVAKSILSHYGRHRIEYKMSKP